MSEITDEMLSAEQPKPCCVCYGNAFEGVNCDCICHVHDDCNTELQMAQAFIADLSKRRVATKRKGKR